jgi:uncharacterized repeat protein (TIGR01451 family)
VSRALYVRYIAHTRPNAQQIALLRAFEPYANQTRPFRNASQLFQRTVDTFVPEREPNDSVSVANHSAANRFAGVLSSATTGIDVDTYSVVVPVGRNVAVSFDGNPFQVDAPVAATLELVDANGTAFPAAFSSWSTTTTTPVRGRVAIFSVPAAGTYYVRITPDATAVGSTVTGSYKLGIDMFSDPTATHTGARPESVGVVNGGFETGDFTGWTDIFTSCGGAGDWYVYSGTSTPLNGFVVPAPPEGNFAAVTDQTGPSTHILYQDVTIPAGLRSILTFDLYYNNQAGLFATPSTLDCSSNQVNQQFRADIITTSAPVDSVAPGDVLQNLYQTQVDDPLTLGPTAIQVDVSALAGQTVRLRFANANNSFYLNTVIDDVNIFSIPQGVDLQIAKLGQATATTGTNTTYSVLVVNNSDITRTNVSWSDTLPANTTFQALTAPAGWNCTTPAVGGTGTVTCTIPSLAAGAIAIFQLTVGVGCIVVPPCTNPQGCGTNLSNTATATSTEADADLSDNTSTSNVTLVDPPPTVTCPESVTVAGNIATGCTITGAVVDFSTLVSVTDNCPGSTLVCVPASGSTLPIGSTTVTCTATDISGNAGSCGFTVNVVEPMTLCFVDDFTGDVFTQAVGLTSGPAQGFWTYTIAATGVTVCGTANHLAYTPGHSLVSSDTDDPVYAMSANFTLTPNGSGTVRLIIRPYDRHILRDRNIGNDPPCAMTPPPPGKR